jgi:SNF2 family DNA or RNA helicase
MTTDVSNYDHQIDPFQHQLKHLQQHVDDATWGLLWEQGTAKSKPVIDTVAIKFRQGEIDGLLVVAPPGVERNWNTDELPKHLPPDVALETRIQVFSTARKATQAHKRAMNSLFTHDGLSVLLISYNGFMTKEGKELVWKFLKTRKVMYALDEAHNIKSPSAKRTKSIIASGRYAKMKRLLTGTPVAIGPFDIYSQIKFLDEYFWKNHGIHGSVEFRNYFGVWYTAEQCKRDQGYDPGYDKLIEYQNLDKLGAWLAEISDRVLKDDVLDLPPKLYSKRYFEMSREQKIAMEELRENLMLEIGDHVISAELPIVALLRYQQIACNYVPVGEDEPVHMFSDKNPRMNAMEQIRDETFTPGIVWARFSHDIDQLMDLLGKKAVRYDGRVDEDQAERNKLAFQRGDVQWFVGNAQKGGSGLTLTQAKTMVYYSNSFRLLDRLQSEDRAHRGGMDEHPVNYIDIMSDAPIDEHIVSNLRGKRNVSAEILGDALKEWI